MKKLKQLKNSGEFNLVNTIQSIEDKYSEINPSFEEYVTNFCHGNRIKITKTKKKFLKRAYEINVIEHRPWSLVDFKDMFNATYFRKIRERLSPFIELECGGNPHFYKLKGIHHTYFVTKYPTRVYTKDVEPDFEHILAQVKRQPLMMHDIRVEARIARLYENIMKNTTLEYNSHNWAFTIKIPAGNRFSVTVNVYTNNKMQIMIGCTRLPLRYDIGGFQELAALMGSICQYFKDLTGEEFYHNPISDWVVQYLHLNQDGVEINGKQFRYSIADLTNHSVFYLKKFGDGKVKPRYEEHQKPKQSINEITKTM